MLVILLSFPLVTASAMPGVISVEGRPTWQVWAIAGASFLLMLCSAALLSNQIEKVSAKTNKTIGIVLLGTSSSLPLLVMVIIAGLSHNFEIAVSNVVSTNIANLTLVIGIIALLRPLRIQGAVKKGVIATLIMILGLLIGLLNLNFFSFGPASPPGLVISFQEGVLMLGAFLLFIIVMRFMHAEENSPLSSRETPFMEMGISLLAGIVVCYCASTCISSLIYISNLYGISPVIIGSTIVVVGTSFPEFAVALSLLFQNKDEVIFSNLITSNVINFFVALGIIALFTPIIISKQLLAFNIPFMVLLHIMLIPFLIKGTISRKEAIILIGIFVLYVVLNFFGGVTLIP